MKIFSKRIMKIVAIAMLLSSMFCSVVFAANDNVVPEATIYTNGTMISNYEVLSGFRPNGSGYGLARIADFLSTKHGDVKFAGATYLGGTTYSVAVTGGDSYGNGIFTVDVYPSNFKKVLPGYQFWYGVYTPDWKMIGTAHGRKQN